MNKFFKIFILLFLPFTLFGQNEFNVWYFGSNAGMDFNGGAPVPLTNGALNTTEGVASISDNTGALLFYTDGLTIWNQNHQAMPNGTGLMGGVSSSQSAIIVKQPGVNSIYYVFTVNTGGAGLRYSEVDMTLQGGLGDININKNILVALPTCEKQTAVKHQNNNDFWIVTHLDGSNAFHSYLLTSSGLSLTPVISNVGTVIGGGAAIGYMKASHNGSRLAIANRSIDNVELFDFDNATGVLTNPIAFNNFTGPGVYGVEFSPNDNLLYISEGSSPISNVYQYNLLAGTPVDIANSRVTVGVFNGWGGALQLGPDYKIYHARYLQTSIGVITDPDSIGLACNYVGNGFFLGGPISQFGLPLTFVSPQNVISANNFCLGDSTAFNTNASPYDSLLWNFGDVNSGLNNTSTAVTPLHLYTDTGTFVVSLVVFLSGNTDTITHSVTIIPLPTISLGNDTTLCQGTTLMLNASNTNATYLWSDNSTNPTFTVNQQGTYWVQVTNICGSTTDSITVNYLQPPIVNLGNDTTMCQGNVLMLDATNPNAAYLWNDNSIDSTFTVTQPGIYWVEVTGFCGSVIDSINVSYIIPPAINFGNDTILCQGATLTLNASNPNATYLWSDNSTNPTFPVTQPGTYWVQVTNICGSDTDSITVNYLQPPVVNLGNDTTLCQGNVLTLDATSSNVTYLWNDNSTDSTYIVTQPGIYWVEVTGYCGSVTDSIDVNYISLPTAILGNDTTICQGATLTLNATNPNATYLWNDNSTNPTFIVTQQGTYWVQVTNICGSASDSISVSYLQPPIVNLGNDTSLCQGGTITLNASGQNATYLWSDNSTGSAYTVTQQGTYWVVVTNICGSVTDSIYVNYIPLPVVDIGNDTLICLGSTLTLTALNPNATYLWNDNSINPTYTVTQQGTYWVTVTNICGSVVDSINVNYTIPPAINLGNDTTICPGESFTLNATFQNSFYVWQDNSTNPDFTVTQPGTYWVVVSNVCDNASDTLEVGPESCNIILEMPNVFTPNGDGLNDNFHPIQMEGIKLARLFIINRWNQILFETDDINTGWNGKDNQNYCADGVYFWIVEFTDDNDNASTKKGFLNLFK